MAVLTKEGYQNINNKISNDKTTKAIKSGLLSYYSSVIGDKVSKQELSAYIDSVFQKINFVLVPTNVEGFNLSSHISKQAGLSEEEMKSSLDSVPQLIKFLKSDAKTIYFDRLTVKAFGYDYEEVYTKGQYIPKRGEKYQEFFDNMKSISQENIDKTQEGAAEQEAGNINQEIISEQSGNDPYTVGKFCQAIVNSGGFCDQRSEDKINIVLNVSENVSVSTVVHEILHAMSYHKTKDGYESGFNTDEKKGSNGLRQNQLFNEIVNEYLTQKVMGIVSKDGESFDIKMKGNNIYRDMIPLIGGLLESYEKQIVGSLLSEEPMSFAEKIGKENFNEINNSLNLIQQKMDFRFYDNSSVFDYMERLVNSKNANFLKGEKLTLGVIMENIEYFQNMFGKDNYVSEMINTMRKLNETCTNIVKKQSSDEEEKEQ